MADDDLTDLTDMAVLDGLDALDDSDRAALDMRLATASPAERDTYRTVVRDTREAMARVADATAIAPPKDLRDKVLAQVRAEHDATVTALPSRRRTLYLVAAAIAAVAAGALGWLIGVRAEPSQGSTADRVFAAADVTSQSGTVASGRATVTYSDSADAAVLVMNDVPPPQPGTVYQMWLEGPGGSMTLAGTMGPDDVAPSTTAIIPGVRDATNLAFTVEPQGGSTQPTGEPVAKLPLN